MGFGFPRTGVKYENFSYLQFHNLWNLNWGQMNEHRLIERMKGKVDEWESVLCCSGRLATISLDVNTVFR